MKLFKLILFLLFFSLSTLNSQIIRTKLDIIAGISARELIHAGLRYQYSEQLQIGLAVGSDMAIFNQEITTYSLDHMIHFGKTGNFSNRPVWYARQGLTYFIEVSENTKIEISYLNLALGREFQFTKWLGFNTDIGFMAQLSNKENGTPTLGPRQQLFYKNALARIQFFISF